MTIEIIPALKDVIKLGVLQFAALKVSSAHEGLALEIDALCEKIQQKYASPSDALEELGPARRLYQHIGVEPTKVRPSSEALLRRVIQGKGLYRINTVVDVCNLCSLEFLLPVGLYDVAKIQGDIQLRLGQEGEGYEGIGKEWVNVAGRFAMVDAIGPFGNPSSDSARTMITLKTTSVLFVIFAPKDYSNEQLMIHADTAAEKMIKYNQGKIIEKRILEN